MIRKVLWLGPAFTIAESLAATALAPAASRWQEGFLGGLHDAGASIGIVANHSERLWPRGPARVAGSLGRFCGIPRDSVAYMNLPGLREGSLARRYGQAIDRFCVDRGMPDVIASYNTWRPVADACRQAGRKHGIPWIPVLLDHNPPTADWANVLEGVAGSAGVVFLSHWAFLHAPVGHKLHLDAGVARVPPLPVAHVRSRVVLYSGALHRWGGIDLLLDAMQHVQTPGVRLVVVGRGGSAETMQRLATTPSVEYRGSVDEATLRSLTEQAEVLANPRPSGVGGNEMNFPSKLLHYLSSLKPVATTLTPGVAPEYGDVVLGARDDSPQGFAYALDRALALTDDARMDLSERIRAFLAGGRLWSQQARRFLEWTAVTTRS
jgi:glycosyltransferase involved in cell wall biosynthesis